MTNEQTDSRVIYGRLSEVKKQEFSGGNIGELFTDWAHLNTSGYLVEFNKDTPYHLWSKDHIENLCLVEEGNGVLVFQKKEYDVKKGYAFKIFPNQNPLVIPNDNLTVISIQMPSFADTKKFIGENLNQLKVINPHDIPEEAFEYEAIGQKIVTCKYTPGIGLIKFTFPLEKIPIHIHPYSDRMIKPIYDSGKGFTYVKLSKDDKGTRYDMDNDTYNLFVEGVIHTNGPVPGEVYKVWALQLPWVDPKIDSENIAGDKDFVEYKESTPTKILEKKLEDLQRIRHRLERDK